MKNFFIIAIIVILLWPTGGNNGRVYELFEGEAKADSALYLYLSNRPKNNDDDKDNVSACNCDKTTGMISYDGGASKVKCPCTGADNCGCLNRVGKTQEQVNNEPADNSNEEDNKEVIESVKQEEDKGDQKSQKVDIFHEFYLVKFTAPWCKPCQVWNRLHRKIVEDAGIEIVEIDIDKNYGKGKAPVTRIPTLWICRKRDKKAFPRDLSFGGIDGTLVVQKFKDLQKIIGPDLKIPTYIQISKPDWKQDGVEESREAILFHLKNDPNHQDVRDKNWPLDFFGLDSLKAIHSDSHNKQLGELSWI